MSREVSIVINEMGEAITIKAPTSRMNDTLTDNKLNNFCWYHTEKGHKTNKCKIMKIDIECLI